MKTKKFQPIAKTDHEKKIIGAFLNGDLTAREAGKAIGLSHQGIINFVASLTRKWYQDHKIKEIY